MNHCMFKGEPTTFSCERIEEREGKGGRLKRRRIQEREYRGKERRKRLG